MDPHPDATSGPPEKRAKTGESESTEPAESPAPDADADASSTSADPNAGSQPASAKGKGKGKTKSKKAKKDPSKLPPKYNERRGEHQQETRGRLAPADLSPEEIEARKARRLGTKRKVAVLMGFCGTGYQGMQLNKGAKTIEGELFAALVQAKCVSEDNAEDIKKIGFQRACRTDKGVHAVGNLVSCKLVVDHLEDPVAAINDQLPPQIRVWDIVRVINSFDSKNHTDGRLYEYLLPTYILAPVHDWNERIAAAKPYTLNPTRRPDELAKLRDILQMYCGTHNHHCFTLRKSAKDPSAMRYIMDFTVSEPEVYGYKKEDGEHVEVGEWVSIKVKGQSFLLHQIRKMIGLAIMLMKTNTPAAPLLPNLLSGESTKVNVPKSPSREHIFDKIVREEHESKCFGVWFTLLQKYPYAFRYFNPQGEIPEGYKCKDDDIPGVQEKEEADGFDE
ncbi:pseudouridine synthase [Catenaria anguillulae PL171]|uniref:Pseudouridine synthase n=1 Tax=Catenaria anguillulae PL171 TaxID=765915 RepID=A0A1Y2HS74_9FUNG|nr:pseudouridine synthase [Catenaria anguillulae PL171]